MKLVVRFNPTWRRQLAVDDRRFWLLRSAALLIDLQAEPRWLVEVYPKRLFVAVAMLVLGFHLATATGLSVWLGRNPCNQVRWIDLALPWHWRGLRAKQGETMIAQGRDSLRRGDFGTAYGLLRAGLVRAPHHADARRQLAQLTAPHDPARALQLMEEGMADAPSELTFWRGLLALYEFNEAYARGLAAFERVLAAPTSRGLPGAVRELLAVARAQLLLEADRAAEILPTLDVPMAPSAHAAEREARRAIEIVALTKLGRTAEALAHGPAPADASPVVLRAEAEACIAAGDAERLRGVLVRLKAAQPANPAWFVYAFECWHRLQRRTLRDRAEAEFYLCFTGNVAALQVFAAALARLGCDDALLRVRDRAMASRQNDFAFNVGLTEADLRRGDPAAAARHLPDWEENIPTLPAEQQFYPELIHRLAHAADTRTETASAPLLAHVQEHRPQIRPAHYRLAVDILVRAGSLAIADELLKVAQRHYSLSDRLAQWRGDLDRRLAARRSGEDTVPPDSLASREPALRMLDAALAAQRWDEAKQLLARIAQQPPAWAASAGIELRVRQVRLHLGARQNAAALFEFRRLVASAGPPRFAAFGLVRDCAARGEHDTTLLLADEVGRTLPDDPAVEKLQLELRRQTPPSL